MMGLIIYFLFFLQGIVQDQTAKSIISKRGFHQSLPKIYQIKTRHFLEFVKRAQCRANMQNHRIEFFYNYNG